MSNYPKNQAAFQKGLGSTRKPAKGLESAALLLAPIMAGYADDGWKDAIGKSLMRGLEESSADQLEAFFADLVKVKRNIEDPANHRSVRAVVAFYRFQQEHGNPPSRMELRDYITENPGTFGDDFPPNDAAADSAWTPIFNAPALKLRFKKPKRGKAKPH